MAHFPYLTIIYLICASLPLVLPIGRNLEYEYSLMVSVITLVLVPLFGILAPPRLIPIYEKKYSPNSIYEITWTLFACPLIIWIPSLLVYYFGGCDCSQMGTNFWLVLMGMPSWVLAHCFMYAAFIARCRGIHIRRISLILSGTLLLLGITTALSFWTNPQAKIVNLAVGFIHGPIYDSKIYVDHGIALARLSHYLLAVLLLVACFYQKQKRYKYSLCTLALGWVCISFFASSYSSATTGFSSLKRVLPGIVENENIAIHFTPQGDRTPVSIKRMFVDANFHYDELKDTFKQAPSKVHIFVYQNQRDKKLWFGGGSTDVTDIFTPSIHLTSSSWPHKTLRHEMVHAVASEFGYFGLGFHPNMAFTEGLAVAFAPSERNIDLDTGSGSLIDSKRLPNIKKLFSPLFWQESGRRAYTVAGSIIKFFVDQYGVEAVTKLYSGSSWKSSLGVDKSEALYQWKKHVTSVYDKSKHKLYTESLYRYRGVYNDRCPHSKADLLDRGKMDSYTRLRQPLGWDASTDYWLWRIKLEPDNRMTRLKMWNKEIQELASARTPSVGQLSTWQKSVENARHFPPKNLEDIDLALLESDILRIIEKKDKSIEILNKVKKYIDKNWVSDDMTRKVYARYMIEETLPNQTALLWRNYLAGFRSKMPTTSPADPWIVTYLRVRNDYKSYFDTRFRNQVSAAKFPRNLKDTFKSEWYNYLGRNLMIAALYKEAAASYKQAAAFASKASRDIMLEHQRRAEYYQAAKLSKRFKFK